MCYSSNFMAEKSARLRPVHAINVRRGQGVTLPTTILAPQSGLIFRYYYHSRYSLRLASDFPRLDFSTVTFDLAGLFKPLASDGGCVGSVGIKLLSEFNLIY